METHTTPTPTAAELRAADLKIVETYVKVIQQEERSDATKYFEELKRLRLGNSAAPTSSSKNPTPSAAALANSAQQSKRTSGAHRNSSFDASRALPTNANSVLKEAQWSGVMSSAECSDAMRVAKRCTAAMLDVFKELESIRSITKQLFDGWHGGGGQHHPMGIPEHYRGGISAADASRPVSARSALSKEEPQVSPRAPTSASHAQLVVKELAEDLYAAAGRAVDTIRSNVVYTSQILNAHVTAPEAQQSLSVILKLVQEENGQQDLATHRNAKQRADDHLNSLGVRHLSAASDLLKSVPRAAPEIYQWQESVPIVGSHDLEDSSYKESRRTSGDVRVAAKAIALERVQQKSKQLCDDLQLSVVPPPRRESDEHQVAVVVKKPTRPTTAPHRPAVHHFGTAAGTAPPSTTPRGQHTIGIDGKAAPRSVRPTSASIRSTISHAAL